MATNGVVYGDSIANGIASRLAALRTGDTWTEVEVATLMLHLPDGGALGPGANKFETKVHDLYYVPGARNIVVNLSIIHGETNDTFDTATQIYDGYRTLIQAQQALGWKVCSVTIPATTEYNDPDSSPYRRPQRIDVNELLRSGDGGSRPVRAGAEYFADFEDISGLGQLDVPISGAPGGTLLSADGIHLLSGGKDATAGIINTAIPLNEVSILHEVVTGKRFFLD